MKGIISLVAAFIILISYVPLNVYADSDTIYIGILPYYAPEKIWILYKPFIAYLNKKTGLRWGIKLYHKYEALIEGICSGEVSIAYTGPNPFALANEKCKAKPLVVVRGEDGEPYYRSIIFTINKEIKSLQELKGKTFAFGDSISTSSYIVPRKILEDKGITMDMIKPLFFNSHERIIEAVARNEAVAGATKSSVFKKFNGLGFKELVISDPLPHHCFCTVGISDNVKERFIKALLRLDPIKNRVDRDIVKDWDPELRYGFTSPPDDYMIRVLNLNDLLKKYK